jgi:competence protein ComEC
LSAIAATLVTAIFSRKKYFLFLILVSLSALFSAAYFSAYNSLYTRKITALAGQTVRIDGIVTDYSYSQGSVRLTVKGKINGTYGTYRTKISLYAEDGNYDYFDRVILECKTKLPENTVDFNDESYSRSQGIFLSGSGTAKCIKNYGCTNKLFRAVKNLRDRTSGKIYAVCQNQSGAFIIAVLCSKKSRISAVNKAAVYRSGLGHIFAVSGTHVVIICSVLRAFLSQIFSSSRKKSAILLAAIWCFALFSGFTPSVVRACIMMSVSQTAVFFHRRSDSANSLGAAAILLTLHCPYALTSASFLLSFSAAFAYGVVSPNVCKGRISSPLAKSAVSYVCINICSLPFCAYFFPEISVISVVANLLLIPLCTAALTLSFIYMLTGTKLLFLIKAADFLANAVLVYCRFFSKSELSYVGTRYSKTLIILGISAIFLLIFIMLKKSRKKSDITKAVAVYLAICIESSFLSYLPIKDKIIIIPKNSAYSAYTAIVLYENSAAVFDIGSQGSNAYKVNQILSEYHVSNSDIFISEESVFTSTCYSSNLPQKLNFFSLDFSAPDITRLSGKVTANDISVTSTENGFEVAIDGKSLVLEKDEILVNGKSYLPESFAHTSEIYLN